MATEAGGDPRCGIGTRLRAARERSGLTILQAAEKLHADPRILESLEAERFEELGAAVFVRGHIRRYAELVRESPTELQELYSASSHAGARPDLTQIPTGGRAQDPRTLSVPGILLVIAVAGIGLVWWFLTSLRVPSTAPQPGDAISQVGGVSDDSELVVDNQAEGSGVVTSLPGVAGTQPATSSDFRGTQSAPAAAGAREPSPTVATVARSSTQTDALPSAGDSADTRSAAPEASTPSDAQSASSGTAAIPLRSPSPPSAAGAGATSPGPAVASTAAPNGAAAPEAEPAAPPRPTGRSTELTLRFSGDSWAEIYDARGNRLFYDIGTSNSVKVLSGPAPLRIILGNPAGVALQVDGREAAVPKAPGGESGVQFTISRSGRVGGVRPMPDGG